FSSRRRHTRWPRDWSSDVCSSDLYELDGSVFGALSKRWDPASTTPTAEDFSVGVVGLSLAVAPRRAGRATIRLDYGVPVTAGQRSEERRVGKECRARRAV